MGTAQSAVPFLCYNLTMRHPEQITADFMRTFLKLGYTDLDDLHKQIDVLQVKLFKREQALSDD